MHQLNVQSPVLVIDGFGYLGLWLIRVLLDEGFTVRVTVRLSSDIHIVEHIFDQAQYQGDQLQIFQLDEFSPSSFERLMNDCELVYYLGESFFAMNTYTQAFSSLPLMLKNIDIVLNAIKSSTKVKRLVLTSSIETIMGDRVEISEQAEGQFTEYCWNRSSSEGYRPVSYARTLVEQRALSFARGQQHWDLVVLNPGFLLGPALHHQFVSCGSSTLINMVRGHYRWFVPQLVHGMVDVRDVAMAHLQAGYIPTAHGRHILVNQTLSLLDIANCLRVRFADEYEFARFQLPKGLNWLFAPLWGMARKAVYANMNIPISFDNSRSIRGLNLAYRPIEQTLVEQFEQLKNDGLL